MIARPHDNGDLSALHGRAASMIECSMRRKVKPGSAMRTTMPFSLDLKLGMVREDSHRLPGQSPPDTVQRRHRVCFGTAQC